MKRVIHNYDMLVVYYRLKLEISKNDTLNKKQTRQLESIRFAEMQKETSKSHEQLRDELIDNKIKNDTRETKKIMRMRARLERNEQIQDSQKKILQHLGEIDLAIEQLATAAQNGDIMKCRELIRCGVDVNEPDASGFLPLHYACLAGSYGVAALLLEHGSDVSSYLTGMSPVEISAKHGHANILTLLYKYGADVEDSGAGGSPPIVSACSMSHLDCIKCLVEFGADINSSDLEGLTALHMTSKLKSPKPIINFLLTQGADRTRISRALLTPLQLALSVLNVEAIEALGGKTGLSTANETNGTTTESINGTRTIANRNKPTYGTDNIATGLHKQPSDILPVQSSIFSAVTLDSPNDSLVMDP